MYPLRVALFALLPVALAATPAQAEISPEAIVRALDVHPGLKGHGPYRFATERTESWRILALGGGPSERSSFRKTSTQAALVVLRLRPLFRGGLGFDSLPWRADIPASLLLDMATGKISIDDYYGRISVRSLPRLPDPPGAGAQNRVRATPLPHPESEIKRPLGNRTGGAKPSQGKPERLEIPAFFDRGGDPHLRSAALVRAEKVDPDSWAYRALQSLDQRYGVLKGYPGGGFGGTRSLGRDEFAAALSATLEKVLTGLTPSIDRDDLAALRQLQVDFREELTGLGRRISRLEGSTADEPQAAPSTTARFSVLLPDTAGRGIAEVLVELPEGITPPPSAAVRLLVGARPVTPAKVDVRGRGYRIVLTPPVSPGTTIAVEIAALRGLVSGGFYTVGITVLPEGELPAYYALDAVGLSYVADR